MVTNSNTITMKWYPWLNSPYQQIISCYQHASWQHALLLHSQPGNGEASLCYALSRWLMCKQTDRLKSCGVCHSCQLMIAGNHPDFYQLNVEKGQHSLCVDNIRTIIDSICNHARQGRVKVIWLSHAELLTEQATNALLKTLEEPPLDTYFLISCYTPSRLLVTLRSRCLYRLVPPPSETLGLNWLREAGGFTDLLSTCAALRLCANAPLAAIDLLQSDRWQERTALCVALYEIHTRNDFLMLLPVLKNHGKDPGPGPLHWLLSLLTDALKWQHNAQAYLINVDKTELIAMIAARWPAIVLCRQWQQWLQCLCQLQKVSGINHELLLTHYLINWEQCRD